jgi:hypothetical protein
MAIAEVAQLPVDHSLDLARVLVEQEVAVAVVTVQQRHVVNDGSIAPEPLAGHRDRRVGFERVLVPGSVPERQSPVQGFGGLRPRDVEAVERLRSPVVGVQPGEMLHELRCEELRQTRSVHGSETRRERDVLSGRGDAVDEAGDQRRGAEIVGLGRHPVRLGDGEDRADGREHDELPLGIGCAAGTR